MNNLTTFSDDIKTYINTHPYEVIEYNVYYDQLPHFREYGFKTVSKVSEKIFKVRREAKNPFVNSNNNKRYYTLDYYNKQTYGTKVAKIPINAGFTCPNIDGTKGFGGCTFCSIKGSGDFAGHPLKHLQEQWDNGYKMMSKKWPDAKYIAYFQAFTNTYAPLESLVEKYNYFINLDECCGINIGTRADCLDEDIVKYLASIDKIKPITVEIGLQSIHESTATIINRCHDLKEFEDGINLLKKYNINTVVHIINGLPKEDYQMMLDTAKYVANLGIDGIKIHLLYVTSDTQLVNQLNNEFLQLMNEEDYIKLVCEQLTYLPSNMVIHRLTGDAPFDHFIGPIWAKKKGNIINKIDKYLEDNNMYQGMNYKKCSTRK